MSDTAAGTTSAPAPNLTTIDEVTLDDLHARIQALVDRKLRFITATCLDCNETFQMLYHFADGPGIRTLRLTVPRDAEVPSITGIVFAAFLVENEVKELFGLNITGIAIDYGGRLLLTEGAPPHPMARHEQTERN